MSIASKLDKVIAALNGTYDENYTEPITGATIEQKLDELAEAIKNNAILNPPASEETQTEETPASNDDPPAAEDPTEQPSTP